MRNHDRLMETNHMYRETVRARIRNAKVANEYRTKYLELRKMVREYLKGNVDLDVIAKLAGYKE